MGEFDLIQRYFSEHRRIERSDIELSVGDDCAVVKLEANQRLAITTDTLVVGNHFLPTISPADLAYKAIAVNLSDLAAMGATPKWISLALTLPEIDEAWLAAFSRSLFDTLNQYQVALIGGDTTKGDLSLTITAQGVLPVAQGLFRHQAQIGDLIYVSGTLGDSAAGLAYLLNQQTPTNHAEQFLLQRHLRPTPRVALGKLLRSYAKCAIDISDGLLADLGHILKSSHCGATVNVEQLPLSQALLATHTLAEAERLALTGGENYELCFTVSPQQQTAMERAVAEIGEVCRCIGRITDAKQGLSLVKHGKTYPLPSQTGFDHFKQL
mgnify:CR=1 FL=1